MTMHEIWGLVPALAAGLALGALFFGGLWWTVQKGLTAQRPAMLFLGSMLLRTGITLAGFYWVADQDIRRMAACLAGFVAARLIATRLARSSAAKTAQEVGHAS
jgi:F1F0 ATPase subunit 2